MTQLAAGLTRIVRPWAVEPGAEALDSLVMEPRDRLTNLSLFGAALVVWILVGLVVTTQDPRTGVQDWNTLKQIASFRPMLPDRGGTPFGVYAMVDAPGDVTLGDEVALLDI